MLRWDNLWQNGDFNGNSFPQYLFSRKAPSAEWRLVSDIRKEMGDKMYDTKVRRFFTLIVDDPSIVYSDINTVWNKFMELFICFGPIVTYSEAWKDYYRQALQEFYDDGVQYLEFRGTLPEVCTQHTFSVAFYEKVHYFLTRHRLTISMEIHSIRLKLFRCTSMY